MNIMMCGSSKIADSYEKFEKVAKGFGATARFFTLGNIPHIPQLNADSVEISEYAVSHCDICVFIISDGASAITWDVELPKADIEGIPIIIMASAHAMSVFNRFEGKNLTDVKDKGERQLLSNTRKVIEEYGFSPRVYSDRNFTYILREEISNALSVAVNDYRKRNLRIVALLNESEGIERRFKLLLSIAEDPMEEKKYRKLAISRLCDIGIPEEDFFILLESDEQGVSRLAAERVGRLVKGDVPIAFFERCFMIGNDSDDIGIIRRLIKSLFALDRKKALKAAAVIDYGEIGTRHRVSEQLLNYAEYYIKNGLGKELLDRANDCSVGVSEKGWLKDIRALRDRLENTGDGSGENT